MIQFFSVATRIGGMQNKQNLQHECRITKQLNISETKCPGEKNACEFAFQSF